MVFVPLFSQDEKKEEKKEEMSCGQKHHTGTYRYQDDLENTIITRTKHKQVETGLKDGSKIVMKVRWVYENEYWLVYKSGMEPTGCLKKNEVIKVVINSCDEKQYSCSYKSSSCGNGKATFVKVMP
ncbi:MAG: hypothetical protein IT223_00365 [Crocinitomicaceae bacterium]|nr:hypothetical protein [Crocinitomicaceae bacterium]